MVESILRSPTVRVEYEQAPAIGSLALCLAAIKEKSWGKGPNVMLLRPDDWFHASRITYVFGSSSLYNRRFHQRRRMKRLLGEHRKLVGDEVNSEMS